MENLNMTQNDWHNQGISFISYYNIYNPGNPSQTNLNTNMLKEVFNDGVSEWGTLKL